MIIDIIQKLVERSDLTEQEARSVMEEIMTGEATDAQVAGFLTALRMKGETSSELIGFARVMRERAEPLWNGEVPAVLDTCGTGGDGSGTFNISTAAAFVAAGVGVKVAKHGNRSASSRCGSADVMEALGLDIQLPADRLRKAITEIGFGFLFAPRFHSSMKYVVPARTQLKIRTVFNMLGPLSNPASARYQVVGVSSIGIVEVVANALQGLGLDCAFVVHSADGMDEISISAPTYVVELRGGQMRRFSVQPEDFGLSPATKESILGGDAATNAAIVESVLGGETGPRRDVVLMNAAAAVVAAGAATTLKEGVRAAAESIDSGAALKTLRDLRSLK
jgi:anthranilate phosphoribosyltransferase